MGGVASLESGEIAGIAVTFSAVALVLLVLLLVFLVRQRQCSSMVFSKTSTTQQTNGHLTVVKQEEKATTNGHAIHQNLKVWQLVRNFFNVLDLSYFSQCVLVEKFLKGLLFRKKKFEMNKNDKNYIQKSKMFDRCVFR